MMPEWLAAQGPPWWVFLLALLTHPATWADRARVLVSEKLLEK